MKRKCDKCDREATVHEVVIRNGSKEEKHLCEQHAAEEGIQPQPHAPINELITKFVMSQSGQSEPSSAEDSCTECGMTWSDFRKQGLVGCGRCYSAFEPRLGPVIERAHEGATHHVGKAPQGSEGLVDREHRIATLRRQLTDAVAAEEYERAATLRDELLQAERRDGADDENGTS